MVFIYFIIIIAFIDNFSQLPIITPFALSVGASSVVVGLIIGMYSLSNMIGNILAGLWIDKVGAKRILAIGMISVSIVMVGYTFVTSPWQLLGTRFVHGFCSGFVVPAAYTLYSQYGKNETAKGKSMAYSGAAVGLAAILGPAIGSILSSRFSYATLFLFIASLMLIFGILGILFLKEKRMEKEMKVEKDANKFLLNRELFQAYYSIFFLLFTLGVLTYILPLKVDELHIDQLVTGILLSIFGIVAILIFILPTNRMYDWLNKFFMMRLGLFIISISFIILYFAQSLAFLVVAMSVFGIGFSLLFPSTSATIVESSGKRRGIAFGIFYACFSVGVIVGSFVAGVVPFSVSGTFLMIAMLLLVVAILPMFLLKRK